MTNVFVASGNLGADLEVRHTPSGAAIGQVPIAVKSGYGDHEKTNWVTVKVFDKTIDAIGQYLTKGLKITVTGELAIDEWEKDGIKHSRVTVIARNIELPPKSANTQGNNAQGFANAQQQGTQLNQHPQNQQQQHARNQQTGQNQQQQPSNQKPPTFDDDIPF